MITTPKILFFDIESGGVNALKSDLGFCLMVGYKWNYEKSAHVLTIEHRHLRHFNDGPLLKEFSAIYNQADLTVAHFGSVFDRRFIQGRLMIHNLPPIPFTRMRDTCMIARSVANYSSNRLKNLGTTLSLKNQKEEKGSGWPAWWFKAMQGDMGAIRKMAHYCKADVLATEELYYRLLPFDNAHPRIYFREPLQGERCPKCGGQVQYRGTRIANNMRYRRFQCINSNFKKFGKLCGAWGHERKAMK
jgi:uncharacterized protein YprB with RNaseH-like and TPR domain